MSYFKKLSPILLTALIAAVVSYFVGFRMLFAVWFFLLIPMLAGAVMSILQQETVSYRFLDKLVIGALAYGILASIGLAVHMSIAIMRSSPPSLHPFYYYLDLKEHLTFTLIFTFVSFMGGLVGIVVKGFYSLYKKSLSSPDPQG